ncbi:hypothetical protein AX17_002283 [Amanita inopinata Kibby_2008]|nr:hypothetical protein AX17_002283 [Amanita inopinata Kibby_2008]
MAHEPSDENDQDSLFGSPGPSRSPSPSLALPHAAQEITLSPRAAADDGTAQNVGTIALPGSQHYAELPKDPLALLSRYPVLQPPVQTATQALRRYRLDRHRDLDQYPTAVSSPVPSNSGSGSSTPSTQSRASSVALPPTARPRRKKKSAKKDQHRASSVSITLPDPSTPPPPNFLRSQTALLGTAGLVAGIKPANLIPQPHATRGSTPANPIVLDEEEQSAMKESHYATVAPRGEKPRPKLTTASKFSSSNVRYDYEAPRLGKQSGSVTPSLDIDPVLLPAPTNQEIVAMLIGQKDIFPVLENILRLIAGQKAGQVIAASPPPASASKSRKRGAKTVETSAKAITGSRAPPLKRRKLSRVPAGAADWDVPYPFQEGEGPEEYSITWEKERGKQLISQLVNLIRTAARKAATKKYLQNLVACHQAEVQQQAQGNEAYKPQIAATGTGKLDISATPQGTSGTAINEEDIALDHPPREPQQQSPEMAPFSTAASFASTSLSVLGSSEQVEETPLDQLISSLIAASSASSSLVDHENGIHGFDPITSHAASAAFVNTRSGEDVHDGLIDSWMNVFQTFPIPSDGFGPEREASFSPVSDMQTMTPAPTPASGFDASAGTSNFNFFDMTSAFNLNFDTHTIYPLSSQHDNNTNTNLISSSSATLNSADDTQQDAEQFMRDIGFDVNPGSQPPLIQSHTQPQSLDMNIDPALLAISQPQPRPVVDMNQMNDLMHSISQNSDGTNRGMEASVAPPMSPSPMPSVSSASSYGDADADPTTPTSAVYDSTMPDIIISSGVSGPSSGQADHQPLHSAPARDDAMSEMRYTRQQKGKWKELEKVREDANREGDGQSSSQNDSSVVSPTSTVATPHPWTGIMQISSFGNSTTGPSVSLASSHDAPPPSSISVSPGQRKLDKQEIVRRAKERRQQLVEELDRVKTQLWEVTIEQSVLEELQRQVLP